MCLSALTTNFSSERGEPSSFIRATRSPSIFRSIHWKISV